MSGQLPSAARLAIGTIVSMALFLGVSLYGLAPFPIQPEHSSNDEPVIQFIDADQLRFPPRIIICHFCDGNCAPRPDVDTLTMMDNDTPHFPRPVANTTGFRIMTRQTMLAMNSQISHQIKSEVLSFNCPETLTRSPGMGTCKVSNQIDM